MLPCTATESDCTSTALLADPRPAGAPLAGALAMAMKRSLRLPNSTPLPSTRSTAFTILNGLETLAVDSAGDLFLSKDAGMRWQRVTHQWAGKAVKVSLAPLREADRLRARPHPPARHHLQASKRSHPPPLGTRVEFELTADSGPIWSSSDSRLETELIPWHHLAISFKWSPRPVQAFGFEA
jgi:hypothetical protein